ncbi:helix-turn-helix domain-containing protein [Embleya sp. NPDC127516]|uniref:helix-turn-helix domain-containing protein n=1 Tax=Embleya sp. NPDC127516 TaxID=3363990 RepID=UPI0037F5D674
MVIPNRLLHPVKEAAALLGIGRTAVYELIKTEELTSTMLAGRRLIPYAALVKYAAAQVAADQGDIEQPTDDGSA